MSAPAGEGGEATPVRFRPPREVLRIAERLTKAGHETWCVGGAVRDALLGLEHLDWDLATSATPEEVQRLFRHTKPIGIEFGTVGVIDGERRMHEVTTFRRDVRTDGRHAEVEFGASLDEDLARRDFTINAIAWSPSEQRLHDPFGGRADLERRLVRAVGDPDARMREDRLRALRAIRFAARFDFDIEPATWRAIVDSAPHLGRLSAERVHEELRKTMVQVRCPSRALERWQESGALATLIPGLTLSPVALATLDRLAPPGTPGRPHRSIARLAALFLDVEPRALAPMLDRLRFSKSDAKWIRDLVERWSRLGEPMRPALADGSVTTGQLRHWVAAIGRTMLPGFMRVAAARWQAMDAGVAVAGPYRRMLGVAFRDPLELGDLAVDGDDLRRAGIPPGPGMRVILQRLLDLVLDDPARNVPDVLLAHARELHERGSSSS